MSDPTTRSTTLWECLVGQAASEKGASVAPAEEERMKPIV